MTIEKAIKDLTDAVDRLTKEIAGGYKASPGEVGTPQPSAKAAKAAPAKEEKAAEAELEPPKAEKPAKGQAEDGATLEQCVKHATALMTGGHRDELVALLSQVGAPNVRSINPTKYAEFCAAAREQLTVLEGG